MRTFVAAELGEFVASTQVGKVGTEASVLTPELLHEGKRSVLNFVAAALAVAGDPVIASALNVLSPFSGKAEASVIGHRRRLDSGHAAFVNALAGNLLDYDDTHLDTVIHPSAPVFPPALALSEQLGRSGSELLLAFVLGAEVECRLGVAVSPAHYARGWHITTTCGVFGAAAAAAKLLRLDPQQTAHALGIAASQSAGIVENLATGAKNVSVGSCARNGIVAALFAKEGYEASPASIEGALGWAEATGETPDTELLLGELGRRWEFAKNTYKPYPCGIVMHAVIDACLALRAEHSLGPEEISSVSVQGDALLLARGDRPVNDARDARVSIHHAAAAPLLWGRAGLEEFLAPAVFAAPAVALRQRVEAKLDATLPPAAARVTILTHDGRELEATVTHATGSVDKPLPDAGLEEKLQALCVHGGSGCNAQLIAEEVWGLDAARSVDRLAAAISRP